MDHRFEIKVISSLEYVESDLLPVSSACSLPSFVSFCSGSVFKELKYCPCLTRRMCRKAVGVFASISSLYLQEDHRDDRSDYPKKSVFGAFGVFGREVR